MSAEAMAWVLEQSKSTGSARLVALAIANQIGKETAEGWAYVADICRWAGVTEQTYQTAFRKLEALGEFERASRAGAAKHASRGHRPNRYRMPMFAATSRPPKTSGDSAGVTPERTRGRRPPKTQGVAIGTVQGTVSNNNDEAPERIVARRVWEGRDPKPATPFIGVVKIAKRLLDAGHTADAVVDAMLVVPTISTGWVEAELNRRRPKRREQVSTARTATEGRVVL